MYLSHAIKYIHLHVYGSTGPISSNSICLIYKVSYLIEMALHREVGGDESSHSILSLEACGLLLELLGSPTIAGQKRKCTAVTSFIGLCEARIPRFHHSHVSYYLKDKHSIAPSTLLFKSTSK